MELNQNEINKEGDNWELNEAENQERKFNKGKLALILVIGFLIGVSIKAQAVRTITMGFEDYKLKSFKDDFSQELIKKKQAEKEKNQAQPEQQQNLEPEPENAPAVEPQPTSEQNNQ